MAEANSKVNRRKRRNGDGTTYKYKGGYRTVITRKGFKPITAMGRTEQESRRKAKEKLAQLPSLDSSLVKDSESLLFGEFITAWLTNKHAKNIADTTYRRYESLTRLHILPALGHMKIRNISKNHVNAFIEKMDEEGQSARSCQQTRALLSAAFKRAVQDDLISLNPVTHSRPVKVDSPQIHPLSVEEAKHLLEVTQDAYMQARTRIAVLYGMRQGEALGLQWKDVNLDSGEVFVWQQVQKVKGVYVFVKLKSKYSVRTLQDLLFHLREAVVIAGDQNRKDAKRAVVDISNKIQADIARLFLAYDVDAPIPAVPFTKDFIAEQLRLITMMLAHVKLAEIEYQGFQAERLPPNVRVEREPFKAERNPPEYMEGAFEHRHRLEKELKRAQKKIEEGDESG